MRRILFSLALGILSLAALTTPPATLPAAHAETITWAKVTSPTTQALDSVFCNNGSDCWAVGDSSTIIHWNGASWNKVASPALTQSNIGITPTVPVPAYTSAFGNYSLNSVICVNTNNCWAVGGNIGVAAIIHWGGSSWNMVTSPINSGAFSSVFCNSSSDCWAAGGYAVVGSVGSVYFLHGSGSPVSWAPINTGGWNGNFGSVFCSGSNDCWAVGAGGMLHWNGTSWLGTRYPLLPGNLNSVFCNSSTDCWAVGAGILHWAGTAWATTTLWSSLPPVTMGTFTITYPAAGFLPIGVNGLSSVSCRSPSDCWAVGSHGAILHWNGLSWEIITSPSTTQPELFSVFCNSSSDCWAVGDGGIILHLTGAGVSPAVSTPISSSLTTITGYTVSSASLSPQTPSSRSTGDRPFILSATSLNVPQGSSATFTVTVSNPPFSGRVTLTAGNLPPGMSVTFTPNPATPLPGGSVTSTGTITVSKSTPGGVFSITIAASSPQGGNQQGTISVNVPTCVIATAAFGSVLAPPVQFLREFRDQIVNRTYLGGQFLSAFNAWYYSWAPSVAVVEAGNGLLRDIVRVMITPLLGVLLFSTEAFRVIGAFNPDVGILITGLMASALIGIIYLAPLGLVASCITKRRITRRTSLYTALVAAALTLIGMLPHGTFGLVPIFTGLVVIETIFLMPTFLLREIVG